MKMRIMKQVLDNYAVKRLMGSVVPRATITRVSAGFDPIPGYIQAGLNCQKDEDILLVVICALYAELEEQEENKLAEATL